MISDLLVLVDLQRATDTEYHLLINCQVHWGSSPRPVCQIVKSTLLSKWINNLLSSYSVQIVKYTSPSPHCQVADTMSALPTHQLHCILWTAQVRFNLPNF
jgi:hypothetical protein